MFLLFFGKMFRGPPNAPLMTKSKFFLTILLVILSVVLLGFVLPWLMSAKSTIAVFTALFLILAISITVLYFILFRNKKENSK